MKKIKNNFFFLDRDGVIIKDVGYLSDFKDVQFLKETFKTLRLIIKKNYNIVIITNQSVVGRGIISDNKLNKIHSSIIRILKKKNIFVKKIYYCPHHPSRGIGKYKKKCKCRKPGNLLIERAIKNFNISRDKSYFIGDRISDKKASIKSKIKFYYRSKVSFYDQIKRII